MFIKKYFTMKNLIQFSILFCMTILFMLTACDQGNDQNSPVLLSNDNDPISNRGDCDACPGANECCCVIEWLSGTGTFKLCGTSDGDAVSCEITGSNCGNDIDGLEHTSFPLNVNNRREEFCMDEGMAFQVERIDAGISDVYTRISCTNDAANPQWVYKTFPSSAKALYDVDDDCLLTECN